jgi:hypothetical protein
MKEEEFNNSIKNILNHFDQSRKKINAGEEKRYNLFNNEIQNISDRFNSGKEISSEQLNKISER